MSQQFLEAFTYIYIVLRIKDEYLNVNLSCANVIRTNVFDFVVIFTKNSQFYDITLGI